MNFIKSAFDKWTLIHFGGALAIAFLLATLPFSPKATNIITYIVVGLIALGVEWYERKKGVKETWINSVVDVMVAMGAVVIIAQNLIWISAAILVYVVGAFYAYRIVEEKQAISNKFLHFASMLGSWVTYLVFKFKK